MSQKLAEVGSRWRFGRHGAVYEISGPEPKNAPGYVPGKRVSQTTKKPINGAILIRVKSLGSAFVSVGEDAA